MAPHSRPPAAEPPCKVGRGHRVAAETQIGGCHDGKERAHFARRKTGELSADLQGSPRSRPVTVEDVVEVPETASAWEALEEGPVPPGRGH